MIKAVCAAIGAVLLVPVLFVAAALGALGGSSNLAGAGAGSGGGVFDIPAGALAAYTSAAVRFGIPVELVAAIGKVECDHDRNPACARPNEAGAEGPMQFLPATFAEYAWAAGTAVPSPYVEHDAVFAAAAMLAANGAPADTSRSVFAYNHDQAYEAAVAGWADLYRHAVGDNPAVGLIAVARAYLGTPYVWGGNDELGIDCSGLIRNAYYAIGVPLPRVAADQAAQGRPVPDLAAAASGDLLAYTDGGGGVDHIALFEGGGLMLEAAHPGTVVREVPARSDGLMTIRRIL